MCNSPPRGRILSDLESAHRERYSSIQGGPHLHAPGGPLFDAHYQYFPALSNEVLVSPRLKALVSGLGDLSSCEMLAIDKFAGDNAELPLGKYLLFRQAMRFASSGSDYKPRDAATSREMSFPQVVLLDPEEQQALMDASAATKRDVNPRFAALCLEKLIEKDGGTFAFYGQSLIMLARQYLVLGRRQEALRVLREAVSVGPRSAPETEQAMLLLAREYLRCGQHTSALALARELMARIPASEKGYREIHVVYLAAKLEVPEKAIEGQYQSAQHFTAELYARFCATEMNFQKLQPNLKDAETWRLGEFLSFAVGATHRNPFWTFVFKDPKDCNKKVQIAIPKKPVKTIEFLENLLNRHGLTMRYAEGFMVVAPKAVRAKATEDRRAAQKAVF